MRLQAGTRREGHLDSKKAKSPADLYIYCLALRCSWHGVITGFGFFGSRYLVLVSVSDPTPFWLGL
jgi:hypothetical protein